MNKRHHDRGGNQTPAARRDNFHTLCGGRCSSEGGGADGCESKHQLLGGASLRGVVDFSRLVASVLFFFPSSASHHHSEGVNFVAGTTIICCPGFDLSVFYDCLQDCLQLCRETTK